MSNKNCFCWVVMLFFSCIFSASGSGMGLHLTTEESSWLEKHRNNLILAPTPNYPPIDFFDKNGKHSGVSGDVSRIIEQKLGVQFKRKKLSSWDDIMVAGKAGKIDLTTIAQRTDKRDEFWLFTRPYIKAPTVILSRIELKKDLSLSSMNSLKVGMVRGYAIDEYLDRYYPDLNIVAVPDDLTGLTMLSMGELDAMIADLPTAGYLISQQRISNLRVAGQTGYSYDYSIAIKKDQPVLRDILDKCLASISQKELEAIKRKWFKISFMPFYMERRFWIVTLSIFIALGGIILVVVVLNRGLKREVKKRTLELTRAHERLMRIFESATQVSVITTDTEGKIKLFNPGAENILDYSSTEVVNKKFLTEIHVPKELEERGQELSKTLGREVSGFDVLVALPTQEQRYEKREWNYIRKDGSTTPVNLGISIIQDHENHIAGYLAVAVDISDRKNAEEALRKSEFKLHQAEKINAIGQLAGGIAHDFNNQLAGIMGFADLLCQKIEDPKLKGFAQQISSTAERASNLTQQLLAFSRKGKFLNVPSDVHKIIDGVVKILTRSIDKAIEIQLQLNAESSIVVGDPAQLQNAFLNLALNARDAMPNGGKLIFSSQIRDFHSDQPLEELKRGKYLCVSVNDDGKGMDKETKRRLFEPFFTTKEVGKGTGLGLASVYGTVKNHGGAIRVYSELGRGSAFHIYLPLFEDEIDYLEEKPVSHIAKGKLEKIMVVDDEAVVISFAREMLQELGYTPIAFQDSIEALQYYQQNWLDIDLVILDMVMPRQSGKELFIALKQINPQIKAILASGFSINGEAQSILDLGVISFIQKPFNRKELSGRLAQALSNE